MERVSEREIREFMDVLHNIQRRLVKKYGPQVLIGRRRVVVKTFEPEIV